MNSAVLFGCKKQPELNKSERLDQMASVNSVLTAAGTAHLPGKFGLLRLMKHRENKVVPISMANADI